MLIIGAGGHAKELLGVLNRNRYSDKIAFYDDLTNVSEVYNNYSVLKNENEAILYLKNQSAFSLGIGNPKIRMQLAEKFRNYGGSIESIISKSSIIYTEDCNLGIGLNIMEFVFISNSVKIGNGCLINAHTSIHHDVSIGDFCEIAPGVRLLGGVQIGNLCSIGSNAVILPNIKIGNNVIVGAGAVVTKDILDNQKIKGIPAR